MLHPLPRVTEIDQDVDDTPYAYYFEQARNGLFARQAMICKCLGIDPTATPWNPSRASRSHRPPTGTTHDVQTPSASPTTSLCPTAS